MSELIDKVLNSKALSYDDYPLIKRKYVYILLAQFMRNRISFEKLCENLLKSINSILTNETLFSSFNFNQTKFLDELKAHYQRGGLGDVKVKKFGKRI